MYIWILLATIMVALSFYNVSPRADKDHALNEVRAATVSNRFKIEHKAMLKTMECEIMYQRNSGCWDAAEESQNCGMCGNEVTRASASGPVNVSCFNPMFYANNVDKCAKSCTVTVGTDTMKTFWGPVTAGSAGNGTPIIEVVTDPEIESGTESITTPGTVNTSHNLEDNVVENYNHFMKHVPHGYDTQRGRTVFPTGVNHFVYCLDEVAERATAQNFIRCDMKRDADYDGSHTTEKRLSSRTRYLVTFAQIPDRWLSKKDRSPLPILVNMLAKDSNSDTVFGWTICDGNSSEPKCKLYGMNARHGNVRQRADSRRAKGDRRGVTVGIKTYERVQKRDEDGNAVLDEYGNPIFENQRQTQSDYVIEYEKLPDNSVFWQTGEFKENCSSTPCMFAYERIPATDTAYHCYNLMVGFAEGKTKDNDWQNKHKDKPINQPSD